MIFESLENGGKKSFIYKMITNLDMFQLSTPFPYIYGSFITTAALVAAAENTIILIVLAHKDQRKVNSNKLLMSLVVSDMIFGYMGFTVEPFIVFNTEQLELIDPIFLAISQWLIVQLVNTSTLSILLLSYNRHLILTRFEEHRHSITEKSPRIVILLSWVVTIPMSLTGFIHWSLFVVATPLFYIGSFVALFTFYCSIITVVRKIKCQTMDSQSHQNATAEDANNFSNLQTHEKRLKARDLKMVKRIRLILGLYILCLMASNMLSGIGVFVDRYLKIRFTNHGHFFFLSKILLYVNSCLNPVIYVRKSKKMQQLVKKFICRK